MFALVLLAASLGQADESGRAVPADLLQKAWTKGVVRVIVELGSVGTLPEGHLPSHAAIAAQRARIASDRAALRLALRGLRHRVLREFKTIPYVGLEVDYDTLLVLDSLPGLATRVHEDILLRRMLAESGPLIKAPDAWAADWDGTGQVIAIVDTGVDKTHSFLAGKVVAEACYDSSGISTCPNGLSSDTSAGAGVPCTFAPADCFHGTHVAGIAAGDGSSFDGIARGASLLAIRVFHLQPDAGDCAPDPAPCALASIVDIAEGLERVYELRDNYDIAAANLSLGGGGSTGFCDGLAPAMDAIIANLRSAGTATTVSSGNNGFLNAISFPACISTAISVGATKDGSGSGGGPADQIALFSNAAPFLSLLAPGQWINSSVPGGGFANFQGTSMASPHVAGAWAVMKQANPDASVDEILAGLQNTGKPIPDVFVTASRIAFTVLQFSASAHNATETAGTVTITVTRSGATFGEVTVDYTTSPGTTNAAVPGEDYTENSGMLTFGEGETTKTFSVTINNDTKADGQRKVKLTLSNPGGGALLGARKTADLNINDNDAAGSIQFSASTYSVGEQADTATITVKRSGGSASDVTVQYATSDGTGHDPVDYKSVTGTVTFDPTGPGATTQTFSVPIIGNSLPDGNRTVNLTLHTPGGGAVLGGQKTAVLTIVDDEIALQFNQASYSVSEGGGSVTITVTRSGPTAPPVGVTYTILPGSATQGADYTGPVTGVLPFAVNQTTRTFTVPIVNDTLAEGPETVLLQLSSPTGDKARLGSRQTAVLTIVDNDAGGRFAFGASAYGVSEGSAAANVTVFRTNGSASNGKVRIRTVDGGTAVAGVDYQTVDQVLEFTGNQSSWTVPITLLTGANLIVDGPRTIKVALDQPGPLGLASTAGPAMTTVTIGDNDVGGTIQWGPTNVSVSESAPSVTLNAGRTGGGADQVGVTWTITEVTAQHGVDYSGDTTGTLSFAGNSSVPTQPLTIALMNPAGPHGTRTFKVTLSAATGGAKLGSPTVATVTILDDEVGFRFDKAAYAAGEGSGGQAVTVIRTGPAQSAASVTVRTVDSPDPDAGSAVLNTDYTSVTRSLTFFPGQTTQTFSVPLKNDSALDGLRTVKLRLSSPTLGGLGVPSEAVLNINDNDAAGTFQFASGTSTVTEDASTNVTVNLTVTRAGGAGGPVQVPWSITGGTATTGAVGTPGVDVWIDPSGTLTFGPDETRKAIQVTILSDADVESNETVKIGLGTPTPGGSLGTPSETTLVVVDSDRKGTIQFAAPAVNVAEANAIAVIAVTRSGNLAEPATVEWSITGGTATRGDAPGPDVDYVSPASGVLSFAAGQATPMAPLTIGVRFDATLETPAETVGLALASPSAGWALGTVAATMVTLVEGTVQFAGLPITAIEGSGGKTITVTRSGLTTQPVTVSYTAGPPGSASPAATANACSPGADYRPVTGTLTFNPGETSKTFSVPLCGDSVAEGSETVTLALVVTSGPAIIGNPGPTATLTITEDDFAGALRFSSATYGASEGQGNASLTVSRTGSGGGVTVHWAITGGTAAHGTDYTGPTEGDLDFAAGQMSKALTIPLVNTPAADGPRTIELELSTPLPAGLASLGSPVHATLTINDNEPILRLNSATYAVGEGSATFNVTVLRSGPTTTAVAVDLVPQVTGAASGGTCGIDEADFATSVIHVDIPANQASKTVPVPICPDTRAEGTETFGLALQSPVGAALASPATATVSLTDNEVGGTLRWSVADASGVEGTTLVLTVTRTGGTASDVTVQVTAHDGDADTPGADAQAGVDYEALPPTTLTFDAGIPSQTVEIRLLALDGGQGPRAFRVTLHDADGGAALGSPSTVIVWILDPS